MSDTKMWEGDLLDMLRESGTRDFSWRVRRRMEQDELKNAKPPTFDLVAAHTTVNARLRPLIEELEHVRVRRSIAEQRYLRVSSRIRVGYRAALVLGVAGMVFSVLYSGLGELAASAAGLLLTFAGLITCAALATRFWLRSNSRLGFRLGPLQQRDLELTGRLDLALDFEIDRLLRLDANERGEREGTLMLTPIAPDLVETETTAATDTPNIRRLRELIEASSTSAFAVAGPRGIGKSTLIRALAADRELFDAAAVVPAPVRYDPDALLRRIHAELALAILRRRNAEDVLLDLRYATARRRRARRAWLAAVVFGLGMALLTLDLVPSSIGPAGTLGTLLACAALVLLTADGDARPRRSGVAASPVVDNAVDALERMRYATESTRTRKTVLASVSCRAPSWSPTWWPSYTATSR
jgi:hypothetical protein